MGKLFQTPINKVLVANRGEIALRVMRSVKEMGIATVAVYSPLDHYAPHTLYADQAICLESNTIQESYLNQEKIIAACKQVGADAIHPGYGFLSENATFAHQVIKEGIHFIGPSPESIRLMGNKILSKSTVKKHGVPLIPGTMSVIRDIERLKKEANQIGYPVMIKASAGGGGKGMRIVYVPEEMEEQMERAMSEANTSFGNDDVFIEKYIENPKHIEVQILGDKWGNIVHLFERECSIQRRHQKVIEEAPSAWLSSEQREQIGLAAINTARACSYYGAGTVEFIVDFTKKNSTPLKFYFLEMNTRLQVEHPVTEMITGIDLVKEQIKITNGEKLSIKQEDLSIRGHSLEVRIYAEDPENDFLPVSGQLNTYVRPLGPGVRVDDGYEEGMQIPIEYDPMIGKLITYGQDRKESIQRMLRAIKEFYIQGVKTTLPFCEFAIQHKEFISGLFSTHFVERCYKPEYLSESMTSQEEDTAILAAFELFNRNQQQALTSPITNKRASRWKYRNFM